MIVSRATANGYRRRHQSGTSVASPIRRSTNTMSSVCRASVAGQREPADGQREHEHRRVDDPVARRAAAA